MTKYTLQKSSVGLIPTDAPSKEWMEKLKFGTVVTADYKVIRGQGFHRKFFAMLNTAYQSRDWPEIDTKYGKARCSFEMFRKYVIVRSGHYEADLTPQGEVRVIPKSMSWGSMDNEEFAQLYSDVLDVILGEFLDNWTVGDMDNAVNQMMNFA